jgi:hypothetical protein
MQDRNNTPLHTGDIVHHINFNVISSVVRPVLNNLYRRGIIVKHFGQEKVWFEQNVDRLSIEKAILWKLENE